MNGSVSREPSRSLKEQFSRSYEAWKEQSDPIFRFWAEGDWWGFPFFSRLVADPVCATTASVVISVGCAPEQVDAGLAFILDVGPYAFGPQIVRTETGSCRTRLTVPCQSIHANRLLQVGCSISDTVNV